MHDVPMPVPSLGKPTTFDDYVAASKALIDAQQARIVSLEHQVELLTSMNEHLQRIIELDQTIAEINLRMVLGGSDQT